jgi:hypothetical protein
VISNLTPLVLAALKFRTRWDTDAGVRRCSVGPVDVLRSCNALAQVRRFWIDSQRVQVPLAWQGGASAEWIRLDETPHSVAAYFACVGRRELMLSLYSAVDLTRFHNPCVARTSCLALPDLSCVR